MATKWSFCIYFRWYWWNGCTCNYTPRESQEGINITPTMFLCQVHNHKKTPSQLRQQPAYLEIPLNRDSIKITIIIKLQYKTQCKDYKLINLYLRFFKMLIFGLCFVLLYTFSNCCLVLDFTARYCGCVFNQVFGKSRLLLTEWIDSVHNLWQTFAWRWPRTRLGVPMTTSGFSSKIGLLKNHQEL